MKVQNEDTELIDNLLLRILYLNEESSLRNWRLFYIDSVIIALWEMF